MLVALTIVGNGWVAAPAAAMPDSLPQHSQIQTSEHEQPCHEQLGDEPTPSVPDPMKPSCCEGGCLCMLGFSAVALNAVPEGGFPPLHLSNLSTLAQGHPQGGPTLLLRPPIA